MSFVETNKSGLFFSKSFIFIIVGTPIDITLVLIVLFDSSLALLFTALPGYNPPEDIWIVLPSLLTCSAFKESKTITRSASTKSDIARANSTLLMFVSPSTSLYILYVLFETAIFSINKYPN